MKARLVLKGFQEEEYPRSDSPTVAKETLKIMMAITANEGFKTVSLDVQNAYLQGKNLDRLIYVEPPPEMKKTGMVWKMNKTANGLYDGGRKFYLKVDEVLRKLGHKRLTGEEAMYTFHKNSKLV